MSSATIFAKFLLLVLLLELVQSDVSPMQCDCSIKKPGRKCVDNGNGCQPDGSLGNCCSGFCHKEADWDVGFCD